MQEADGDEEVGNSPGGPLTTMAARVKTLRRINWVKSAWAVEFTVPIQVVSEANRRGEHWSKQHARFKEQEMAVIACWAASPISSRLTFSKVIVTITKLGGRKLDGDNLQSSGKHVRDTIAALLGVDDGSDSVVWAYRQETAGAGSSSPVGVRVRIQSAG